MNYRESIPEVIPSKQNTRRDRFGIAQSELQRGKTAGADAVLIAQFGWQKCPESWTPPPAEREQLQALSRRLEDVQQMRISLFQRFLKLLLFPERLVQSTLGDQGFVATGLDNSALIHDENAVCHCGSGELVRNEDHRFAIAALG